MDICVITGDRIFFSAVEGVSGAMGHRARQVTESAAIGSPDVAVFDFASLPFELSALIPSLDLLRSIAFIPQTDAAAFVTAHGQGIPHVHKRGTLATELPRILAEYAGLE